MRHELLPLIADISRRDPVPILVRTADLLPHLQKWNSDGQLPAVPAGAGSGSGARATDANGLPPTSRSLAHHRRVAPWRIINRYCPGESTCRKEK